MASMLLDTPSIDPSFPSNPRAQ